MFPILNLHVIVKAMNFRAMKERTEKMWHFQTAIGPTILRVVLVPVIFKLSFSNRRRKNCWAFRALPNLPFLSLRSRWHRSYGESVNVQWKVTSENIQTEYPIQTTAGWLPALTNNHWQAEPGVFMGNIKVSTAWQCLSVTPEGANMFWNLWALRGDDNKDSLGGQFLCVSLTGTSCRLKTVSFWSELCRGVRMNSDTEDWNMQFCVLTLWLSFGIWKTGAQLTSEVQRGHRNLFFFFLPLQVSLKAYHQW